MKSIKQKGFTLVELLVVIAIIGLLSTIAVVSLGSARVKARDVKRIADVKQMTTALEGYYSDNNGYPYAAAATGQNMTGVICTTATTGLGIGSGLTCTGATYMGLIPAYPTPNPIATAGACPVTGSTYATPTPLSSGYCYYTASLSGTQLEYKLVYTLEGAATTADFCIAQSTGVTCS